MDSPLSHPANTMTFAPTSSWTRNKTSNMLLSISAGVAFGAALTVSRVYLPSVIINQMRLRDFHMLEVFLTACGSSGIAILLLERLGIAKRNVRSNSHLGWFSPHDGNIVGGVLLGAGMALTGACPGTVLPQLALGIPSARATTLGGLLGGFVYAKVGTSLRAPQKQTSKEALDTEQKRSPLTIAAKLNLSPRFVLLAFEMIAATMVALSMLLFPGRSSSIVPTVFGGLLIALAQVLSITLTSSPLGVSTAYEQIGAYCWNVLGSSDVPKPASPPKAILFAIGILLGSLSAGMHLPTPMPASTLSIPPLQAVIGGFILTFGARVAGGCTSGHGLSGLSAMSFSSLLTTASMFGAGVAVRLLI